MFLEHCTSLLRTGHSSVSASQYDEASQVLFRLQSGVRAKKLNSLRSALLMIEVIKAQQKKVDVKEQYSMFNNFVEYVFGSFSEAAGMAVIKYAIADRRLVIRNLSSATAWPKISQLFRPALIDNTKDPVERSKYERCLKLHEKLRKCKCISDSFNEYVAGQAVPA